MAWPDEPLVPEAMRVLVNAADHMADAIRDWARRPSSNTAMRMEGSVEAWERAKQLARVPA